MLDFTVKLASFYWQAGFILLANWLHFTGKLASFTGKLVHFTAKLASLYM